jgi:hypothetical protein
MALFRGRTPERFIWLQPCQRKATFNIPDKYIHAGDRVDVLFDLGIVNMEAEFEDEVSHKTD